MWSTGRLLLILIGLFSVASCAQALKSWTDMNWEENPELAWPYTLNKVESRVVVLLLNIKNYTGDEKEWKFIASGVLLDNSRILTSYNPFKQLISDPEISDNILALIPAGYKDKRVHLKIANLVCARPIACEPDDKSYIWPDNDKASPIHDLMVVRIDEEIGISNASYRVPPLVKNVKLHETGHFHWLGQIKTVSFLNAIKSLPAGIADVIDPEVHIFTLGYMSREEMLNFDTIHEIIYEADDDALEDCDEWLPRQWGFFICIRNIGNFPGLGSGAPLFSKNRLFGIGSFGMFKMDKGILVFTDVRKYEELIEKTCGDEEFV